MIFLLRLYDSINIMEMIDENFRLREGIILYKIEG